MENIFDALCSSLAEPEVREQFQQAEGVDLMVLIMKYVRSLVFPGFMLMEI